MDVKYIYNIYMSDFLRFIGIGARAAQSKYDVDIFNLKKKGCENNGGKIIFSNNADTCEVTKSDGSKKYIYPVEIVFGEKKEKQSGGRKRKTKTKKNKTKKNKTKKNKKSRRQKLKF
jgi:hypothetical protein